MWAGIYARTKVRPDQHSRQTTSNTPLMVSIRQYAVDPRYWVDAVLAVSLDLIATSAGIPYRTGIPLSSWRRDSNLSSLPHEPGNRRPTAPAAHFRVRSCNRAIDNAPLSSWRRDSNPRPADYKSAALAGLSYASICLR